jgi:FkbM family methyltransferase
MGVLERSGAEEMVKVDAGGGESLMSPRLIGRPSSRERAAFGVARGVARLSRTWGQVGLGTIFKALRYIPSLSQARGRVQFMPGGVLDIEFFEPYWAPSIVGGRPYEPDVMAAMKRFARLSSAFIDCGANYGFWSIVATSQELSYSRAIAVEASPSTFARLRANAGLNDERFVCVNRAISDAVGQTVLLDEQPDAHARAHVIESGVGTPVLTTTIDALIEEYGWQDVDRIVLKLDVEGQENAAIRGASKLASARDHVWIVEDFASRNLGTVGLLAELGYATFYLRPDGRCVSVPSVDSAMAALRDDLRPGYARNFAAAKPTSIFHETLKNWSLDKGTPHGLSHGSSAPTFARPGG